jgi:DNA-binding NarL/FixJ family response regulator
MRSNTVKIVIADDSAMIRERIKYLVVTVEGAEVVGEAANGIEALRLIKETDPDLVILDIRMPELNGIDTLERIKKSGSRTKVCMLSNYPYPQYKERCIAIGADYFFDKSQDFHEVRAVIADLAQAFPNNLHE